MRKPTSLEGEHSNNIKNGDDIMNQPAAILIISPDTKLQQGIGKALSDINPGIKIVSTSREGLKRIREEGFDIVLADSRMDDLSSQILVRKIVNKSPDADILVGLPAEDLFRQNEVLEWGTDDVFEIPPKPEELHLKISKLLKEKAFWSRAGWWVSRAS